MHENTKTIREIALLGSGGLYLIALFCPAFDFAEGNSGFILGFVCLLFGFEHLAWYANIPYFGSLVFLFLKRPVVAAALAAGAVALGLTTLGIEEVPKNESGTRTAVAGYGLGFYLWIASMLTVLFGAIAAFVKSRSPMPAVADEPPVITQANVAGH
jgi:hypothetical protein